MAGQWAGGDAAGPAAGLLTMPHQRQRGAAAGRQGIHRRCPSGGPLVKPGCLHSGGQHQHTDWSRRPCSGTTTSTQLETNSPHLGGQLAGRGEHKHRNAVALPRRRPVA